MTERVDEIVDADGLCLRRVGLSALGTAGIEITGAAADVDESAMHRAAYELAERASIVDAMTSERELVVRTPCGEAIGTATVANAFPPSADPARWQLARSNGVALSSSWSDACERARLELAERDRILRAWYGIGPPPEQIEFLDRELMRSPSYTWHAYAFPTDGGWSADIDVVMVFGFPKRASAPLLRGSAGRHGQTDASRAAARECRQSLAFLWDEPVPTRAPAHAPSVAYHLEHYLWPGAHGLLREFLAGERSGARGTDRPSDDAEVRYVDLTPTLYSPTFRVTKALCDAALPLALGHPPAVLVGDLLRRGPHPIA